MILDLEEMAQLDQIEEKLDGIAKTLGQLGEKLAVAINDHGHLKTQVGELTGRVDQMARDITQIQRDQHRLEQFQRDLTNLGNAVRDIQTALPSQIQAAVRTAIEPLQLKQGLFFRVLQSVGSGGWAVILILITILLTRSLGNDDGPATGVIPALEAPRKAP